LESVRTNSKLLCLKVYESSEVELEKNGILEKQGPFETFVEIILTQHEHFAENAISQENNRQA